MEQQRTKWTDNQPFRADGSADDLFHFDFHQRNIEGDNNSVSLPVIQLACGTSGNAVPTVLLDCGTSGNAVPTLLRPCTAPPSTNPCDYEGIRITLSGITACLCSVPPPGTGFYYIKNIRYVVTPPRIAVRTLPCAFSTYNVATFELWYATDSTACPGAQVGTGRFDLNWNSPNWELVIQGTGVFSVDNHVVNQFYVGGPIAFGTYSGWASGNCWTPFPADKLNTYGGSLTVEAP